MWQNTRALDKYDYQKYFYPPEISDIKKNIAVAIETNVDAEPKEIIIKKKCSPSRNIIYSKDICCYRDMLNR